MRRRQTLAEAGVPRMLLPALKELACRAYPNGGPLHFRFPAGARGSAENLWCLYCGRYAQAAWDLAINFPAAE